MEILEKIHLLNKMTSHSGAYLLRQTFGGRELKSSLIEYELVAYDVFISQIDEEIDMHPNKKHNEVKDLERLRETLKITVTVYREIVEEYLVIKGLSSIPFNMKRYDLVNELIQHLMMHNSSDKDLINSVAKEVINTINKPVKLVEEKLTIKEISAKYALELKRRRFKA